MIWCQQSAFISSALVSTLKYIFHSKFWCSVSMTCLFIDTFGTWKLQFQVLEKSLKSPWILSFEFAMNPALATDNSPEKIKLLLWSTGQRTVTVVDPWNDKAIDYCFCSLGKYICTLPDVGHLLCIVCRHRHYWRSFAAVWMTFVAGVRLNARSSALRLTSAAWISCDLHCFLRWVVEHCKSHLCLVSNGSLHMYLFMHFVANVHSIKLFIAYISLPLEVLTHVTYWQFVPLYSIEDLGPHSGNLLGKS